MKKILVVVIALSMLLGLFVVRPASVNAAGFGDVPGDYWAKDQIDYLVAKGVIAGFPDGTFKPETPVTREQFAKMVCIAKGIKEYKPSTATFKDANSSRWSYGFVEAAAKAGYIKGYPDGTFGPEKNITRQELSVLGVRVLGKEAEAQAFKGNPVVWGNDWKDISNWAVGAVVLAYRPDIQIMTYRLPDVLVAPKNASTRAECAYAIYKIVVPPQVGGKVTIAQTQEPDALTAFLTSMSAQRMIGSLYEDANYGHILGQWPNGTYYPRMALNVPNVKDGTLKVYEVNNKTYMQTIYYLRKGVKWSDGVPVDYEKDIKYAVNELYLSGKISQITSTDPWDKIEKIEFPDPYTLVVTWNGVVPTAVQGLPIFPSHYYSKVKIEDIASSDLVKTPVHAGPYRIKTWVKGSYITLEPNPYWYGWAGSKPLIQEFVFKFIPDTNTMLMNVIAGSVDATLLGLGVKEAAQAEKIKTIKIQYAPSTYWEHLDLNISDPILNDIRVRKAIACGINYQDVVDRVFMGKRLINRTFFFPPNSKDTKANTFTPGYDPNKAKQLLDEAGWKLGPDGYRYKDGKKLTLELSTTTRQDRKDQAVVIQDNLKQIGIEIIPKFLSSAYFFGTYLSHRMFQIAMYAWGSGLDLTHPTSYELWNSSQIPKEENNWSGQNYEGISDPALDNAVFTADHELDPDVRQKAYFTVLDKLVELLPQIPLNWWVDVYTPKDNLAMASFQYDISSGSVYYTYNGYLWYWEKK